MSFQAYLDTIQKQTGLDPNQIKALFDKQGTLKATLTATEWVGWCEKELKLGRGHAMALKLDDMTKGNYIGRKQRLLRRIEIRKGE